MTFQEPTFSIIIPTRNRSKLLRRCIDSILHQVFEEWELVIVDDGSTDDTASVVSSYADARINYFFQKHSERSTARNFGIGKTTGRYICFIDDDDYITRFYLSDFFEYYQKNQFPDIILRTGFIRKEGNKEKRSVNYDVRKHKNPVNFVLYNMCGVGCLCIPKLALNDNQFPVDFPHWQDTHLFIRLLLKFELKQLNSYNYYYVIHQQMGSKLATQIHDPLQRADLNVAAIEHLFTEEKNVIFKFVSDKTLNFLKAEKYLQYSNNAYTHMNTMGRILLKKSLNYGVYISLWKSYLINLKLRLFNRKGE